MSDYTTALPLPRARTLVHPGPVGPIRIEHRHANHARHFRLALEPGRTLEDAIIEPLLLLGVTAASMTLLGGQLDTLLYCVAPPDPTGERVANYTRPIPAGPATLIFGNATLGKNARGEPIVHCHATFVCADGQRARRPHRGRPQRRRRGVPCRCWPRRWTASSCASRRTRKPTCR